MTNVEKIFHDAHTKLQRDAGVSDSRDARIRKSASHFVEPTSETWVRQHRTWHPDGYYEVFCVHDRPFYVTCSLCKRNTQQARLFKLK